MRRPVCAVQHFLALAYDGCSSRFTSRLRKTPAVGWELQVFLFSRSNQVLRLQPAHCYNNTDSRSLQTTRRIGLPVQDTAEGIAVVALRRDQFVYTWKSVYLLQLPCGEEEA